MPLEEPRADQILDAVVEALEGISIGAGYFNDLKHAGRRRMLVTELNQTRMPCSSVWGGPSIPVEGCLGPTKRDRMTVLIETWTRSEKVEQVDRDGFRAMADIRRAMLTAGNFGLSFVVGVQPAPVKSDHQEYADKKLGWKVVGFTVDYNWTASAP